MINFLRDKLYLVNTVKQLELELHNQQQVFNTLQEELNNCNSKLFDKHLELSNLNKYTSELEFKLQQIKELAK